MDSPIRGGANVDWNVSRACSDMQFFCA